MFCANLQIIGAKCINKNCISVHLCSVMQDYIFSCDFYIFDTVGFRSAPHKKKKTNPEVNHPTGRASKTNIAAINQIFWSYFLTSRAARFIVGHLFADLSLFYCKLRNISCLMQD